MDDKDDGREDDGNDDGRDDDGKDDGRDDDGEKEADQLPEILDTLLGKKKCLVSFSNDMLGRIVVGSEVIIGRFGSWYEGVIHQVPGRRKRQKLQQAAGSEPRLFHFMVFSDAILNPIVMKLVDENYAQGGVAPSSLGDRWAWARVNAYVACAYVECGECLTPYLTAVGHTCVKCSTQPMLAAASGRPRPRV